MPDSDKPFMASMGIYVFSTQMLFELLQQPGDDFGKNLIPGALPDHRLMGYVFDGYWADIGTIRRFYQVNLDLASPDRPLDLFGPQWPIFTRPRFLPPSEIRDSRLDQVLLADGCYIYDSDIDKSVIGLRSIVGPHATIRSSVIMGADYYETDEEKTENKRLGRPDMGIGEGSTIEGAIIDKKARIGRKVHIRELPERADEDHEDWVASDGLVIVPKSAVIPDGTVI
jgi:glucose-1-phosphate adenylyltransferase